MPTLPAELLPLIVEFAPLFSKPVWERAKTLLVGAILAVGNRTVTACLCVTSNSQDKRFQNYHRVLNRGRWSALRASQVLLRMLVATFASSGELIIGIDGTIERRRGERSRLKGYIATRFALRNLISSRRADSAGCVRCSSSRSLGRVASGDPPT
jgi:hypothetical protein